MIDRAQAFLTDLKSSSPDFESVFNSPDLISKIVSNELSLNQDLLDLTVRIADTFEPEMEQIAEFNQTTLFSLQFCGHFRSFTPDEASPVQEEAPLSRKFVDMQGYLGLVDREEFHRMTEGLPKGPQMRSHFESIWDVLSEFNQNKKICIDNYYPVLICLYPGSTGPGPKIGDYLHVKGVWSPAPLTVDLPEDEDKDEAEFQMQDFEPTYRAFYGHDLVPLLFALSTRPARLLPPEINAPDDGAHLKCVEACLERQGKASLLSDVESIEQLCRIVCSKIYYGAIDILEDRLSATMLLFALLSSKQHKLNGDFLDFISVNLFHLTPTARNRLIRFSREIGLKKVYVNISSSGPPPSQPLDPENTNLTNLPPPPTEDKQSFSNLQTEQFTFDQLLGKRRLVGEKCHEAGVVLQGSLLPGDSSSVLIVDETTLTGNKQFGPFASKQLFALQSAIDTHTLEWDFKFGTKITHDCLHRVLGLSSSMSVLNFGFKVHVGPVVRPKKGLQVVPESDEHSPGESAQVVEPGPEPAFLDATLVPLFRKEFVAPVLAFLATFISKVEISDPAQKYIQNHFVSTRKELKKTKNSQKDFNSGDLQNCIRIAKHISACRLQLKLTEQDYARSFEMYERIRERMCKYLAN